MHGSIHLINNSKMGRSVITNQNIPAGLLLEECPVIDISPDTLALLFDKDYEQWSYTFQRGNKIFLALGLMTFVNHKDEPNCEVTYDGITACMRSTRIIDSGEHLSIWYENINEYKEGGSWER